MPYVEVNGANIYYNAYGEDKLDHAPIVLIHGSEIDSHTDWDHLIPKLAEHYRVFVPDCRGHGHSNNPNMSYSFRELADDTATFVRTMGYSRCHIIGHSNGGNVALVTLVEHPDIIQTAVLQAANSFVTPYLMEREPVYFDADRIEREEPERMKEMIALHGETNGKDYWRTLVKITMIETISQPNYTPEELSRVDRPVLAIMGANDKTNAADEHAQFIAKHIPNAEVWVPENTGHNVHHERPEEWLAKVLDFLERRG